MLSSFLIRSSSGGWVENSLVTPPPEKGWTMNMWEVASFPRIGIRLDRAPSFRRALAFPPYLLPEKRKILGRKAIAPARVASMVPRSMS